MKVYVASIQMNNFFEMSTKILGVYKTEEEAEKAVGNELAENASQGEMREYIQYCQNCLEVMDTPITFSEYLAEDAYYDIDEFEIAD